MKPKFRNFLKNLTVCLFLYFALASVGNAKEGNLLATFPGAVYFFAENPSKAELYASANHDILVIDERTLKIITKIPLSGAPRGLAISEDGTKLYVATTAAQQLAVIDTVSRTLLPPISLPFLPYDVKVGKNGRVYVTPGNADNYRDNYRIMQIDSTAGKFSKVFPKIEREYLRFTNGFLQISPDKNALYFGDHGSSPGALVKYDVSTDTPRIDYQSELGTLGSNGEDLEISPLGNYIYYVMGSGNGVLGPYDIARIRTSDMTFQGSLSVGAYPTAIAISPNEKIAYTAINQYISSNFIGIWNTETQQELCRIDTKTKVDSPSRMIVDSTHSHLFAAYSEELRVYSVE